VYTNYIKSNPKSDFILIHSRRINQYAYTSSSVSGSFHSYSPCSNPEKDKKNHLNKLFNSKKSPALINNILRASESSHGGFYENYYFLRCNAVLWQTKMPRYTASHLRAVTSNILAACLTLGSSKTPNYHSVPHT